jgi:hypothetical protein
MDLAALSTLHQLLLVNALRLEGAWPHAIKAPGKHSPLLEGGGSQPGGPHGMGPDTHPGAQAGCLVPGGKGLLQRGTWKSASGFLTLQIFLRICPRKGLKIALIGVLRGR